jgi:hypothetical protein
MKKWQMISLSILPTTLLLASLLYFYTLPSTVSKHLEDSNYCTISEDCMIFDVGGCEWVGLNAKEAEGSKALVSLFQVFHPDDVCNISLNREYASDRGPNPYPVCNKDNRCVIRSSDHYGSSGGV